MIPNRALSLLSSLALAAAPALALGDVQPAESVLPIGKKSSNIVLRVLTPDFDGDGRKDVLVCSHVMQLWRNLGHGVLETLPPVLVTDDAVTADLDGDGLVEIVSFTAAGVREQEATLPFGFGPVVTLQPNPGGQDCVAVGDFNDDGEPDIVSRVASNARTWLNDGAGGLLPSIAAVPSVQNLQPALADVNQDGELDLVGQLAAVLLGAGDGTFAPQAPLFPDSGTLSRLADFDGDGLPDLLVAELDEAQLLHTTMSVLHGNGDATFSLLASGTTSTVTPGVDIGDADGDGAPDILTGAADTNEIAVHKLAGSTLVALPGFMPLSDHPRGFVFADLDGDGRNGVIDAEKPTSTVLTVYVPGDGTGSLATRVTLLAGPVMDHPIAADIDGDGTPEIVALRFTAQHEMIVLDAPGDGTLGPPGPPTPVASNLHLATRLRLNSDNLDDVLLAASGELRAFLSNGDGTFTSAAGVTLVSESKWAVGDLDADGDDDIVQLDHTPVWHPSAGDGSLLPPVPMVAPGLLTVTGMSVALADADGDGVLDLFTGHFDPSPDSLQWFRGLGSGVFEAPHSLGSSDAGYQVALRAQDLDADGDVDLLACGGGIGTKVTVVRGDGSGQFGPPLSMSVGTIAEGMFTADLNGDGLPDLVVDDGLLLNAHLRWYALQLVDGSFTQPRRALLGSLPFDLDDDGDDDLLDEASASFTVGGLYAELMQPTEAFVDVGPGLAGSTGNPRLSGTGPLRHPGYFSLDLLGALPGASCALVVGTSSALLPPGSSGPGQMELGGFSTSVTGSLHFKGRWPALPANTALYVQAWITDAAASGGLASSNIVQLAGE